MTVAIRSCSRRLPPSEEMAATIDRLAAGGARCFDAAELRPCDERWWRETTAAMAADVRAAVALAAESDERIAATAPESVTGPRDRPSFSSERARAVADYVKARRAARPWVLAAGALEIGCERIVVEGVTLGRGALAARSQLRAFALVICATVGTVSIGDEEGDE